jgi:hypothetical protein
MTRHIVWNSDMANAPKDGNPVLLFARLNIDGAVPGPVVGFWHLTEHEWRPLPHDPEGTELYPSHWAKIPDLPR